MIVAWPEGERGELKQRGVHTRLADWPVWQFATPLVHRSGLNSPLGSHSHWAIVLYESIVLQRKGPATTRIRRPTS